MALGAFGLTTNGSASDLTITTAATTICTAVTGLTGMQAMSVWLQLAFGTNGGAISAYVQTGFDSSTWMDIACIVFGTASETAVLNFSALTPKLTQIAPSDGAMTADTSLDGFLGDRVRLKVVSTGTAYAGSTLLKGRIIAR